MHREDRNYPRFDARLPDSRDHALKASLTSSRVMLTLMLLCQGLEFVARLESPDGPLPQKHVSAHMHRTFTPAESHRHWRLFFGLQPPG